jgi:hypothetical protein
MAHEPKAAAEKEKRLDEYERSRPAQLSLFELLGIDDKPYSNTIELYDFMPKYYWGKVERINGQFLPDLEREFECRGIGYKLRVTPASLNGKYYYPSKREEVVESALRKLATDGHGVFLDDAASVTFTLYQLQKELKLMGHTYSKDQIKEALQICKRINLIVTSEDGSTILESSIFETLGLQTQEDWKSNREKTRCFVRFNSLVTASIKSKTFRLLNYEKSLSFESIIARQLHKRMSHHFRQASLINTYDILLTTLIRDFGLTRYKKLPDNLRDAETALKEMQKKEVVLNYKVEKILDARRRNKLADAKLILTPHPKFTADIIKANQRYDTIMKTALPSTTPTRR